MGYLPVEKTSTKVRIVHQLGSDGERYAEDITIEGPEGRWLVNGEVGDVGTANATFTKTEHVPEGIRFPDA